MKKKILICGSVAFDTIMFLEDKFSDHILTENLNILNLAFNIKNIRKVFGGCAANIAYSANLLNLETLPMATVGKLDFASYESWLNKNNIDCKLIKQIDNFYTGQSYIITDCDNNQITSFYAGAMDMSHCNNILQAENFSLAIISPDGKKGMIEHTKQCINNNIPFLFDPGQALQKFSKEQLQFFIKNAKWIIVNEYESEVLIKNSALTKNQIAQLVDAFFITKSEKGSIILADGKLFSISAITPEKIVDPTGCGDCYRAGILFGLLHNFSWQKMGQLANLLGSIKVATQGPQSHNFNLDMIKQKYFKIFKKNLL